MTRATPRPARSMPPSTRSPPRCATPRRWPRTSRPTRGRSPDARTRRRSPISPRESTPAPAGLTVNFTGRVDERGSRPAGRHVGLRRREQRDRNPGRHRRAHLRRRRPVHGHGDRDRRVRLGHEEQGDLARPAQLPARRILHGDAAAGTGAARGRLRRLGIERPGRHRSRRTSGTSATPRWRPA